GFVALALAVARLAGRLLFVAPARVAGAPWERALAAVVQACLYALPLVAIVSGWLVVSASPLPIPTRFFRLFVVPAIARPDPVLFGAAALTHELGAYAILALVALHAAGALKHHFLDRDDTLVRMLPWRGRGLRSDGRQFAADPP